MRTYAESTGLLWFILSAEHGLVRPDEWVEPYEKYLPETSSKYQTAWGQKVVRQLESAVGPVTGVTFDLDAGANYVDSVGASLETAGASVVDQLHGLSLGRRLAWYNERTGGLDSSVETMIAQLRDQELAMSVPDFIAARGAVFRSAGMYSFWVDRAGARDLSAGLGYPIEPGLIYAGLAGATRTGGSTSKNTLWSRIATMHLGKTHRLSTLRLSLGSILSQTHDWPAIDEGQVTSWMKTHLRVVALPVADADTLGDLETKILIELDPPLNLAKVGSNDIRLNPTTGRSAQTGRDEGLPPAHFPVALAALATCLAKPPTVHD